MSGGRVGFCAIELLEVFVGNRSWNKICVAIDPFSACVQWRSLERTFQIARNSETGKDTPRRAGLPKLSCSATKICDTGRRGRGGGISTLSDVAIAVWDGGGEGDATDAGRGGRGGGGGGARSAG